MKDGEKNKNTEDVEILNFPLDNGECLTCRDSDYCPMEEMLPMWRKILAEYGEDVKEKRPDLWDEFSVDDPIIEDGIITWCPLHHVEEED